MLLAFDFETWLIRPGLQLPPAVCMSWCEVVPPSPQGGTATIGRSGVVTATEGCAYLTRWLEGGARIIGANTAFDALVSVVKSPEHKVLLKLWADALEQGRVHDVFTRQKLLDIAAGCYRYEEKSDGSGWLHHGYNLADLSRRLTGRELSKPTGADDTDHWRLRFSELEGVPIEQYPRAAYDYALEDAVATAEDFIAQEVQRWNNARIKRHFPGKDPFVDEARQTIACVPLKAMSAYGLRTDGPAVERFAEEVIAKIEEQRKDLVEAGLVREPEYHRLTDKIVEYIKERGLLGFFVDGDQVRLCKKSYLLSGDPLLAKLADWKLNLPELVASGLVEEKHTRDTKLAAARCAAAYAALGMPVPRTASYKPKPPPAGKGHGPLDCISLDADACSGSGDPILETYSSYTSLAKTLSNDIPMLRAGVYMPVHTRFDELIKTGRTSSSKPNVQNVRRLPGIRECFKPRPGYVFIDVDFAMLELHTLAQVCMWALGFSTLGEALNSGRDPHLAMAAVILGIQYEEAKARKEAEDSVVDNARTAGKGCFHPDTEVLTRQGWVRVGELTMEHDVCSARFDGEKTTLEYARPLALTERDWRGELVHVKNEGIDLRLTPDHRMVAWQGKRDVERLITCEPEDMPRVRYWPNAGTLEGETIQVDERLLRLAVAVQADGHITESGGLKLGFTKQRKIDRLAALLEGDDYKRSVTGKLGVTIFRPSPELTREVLALLDKKSFPFWWTRLSAELREVVLEEVAFWDASGAHTQRAGNKRAGYTFCSTARQNVEVLQTIATTTNRKTRSYETARTLPQNTLYHLSIKTKHRSRGGHVTAQRFPYVGKVFCLTTHNDSVVVRDGGVPVITRQCNFGAPGGLSAKTFVVYAWTNYRIRLTLAEAENLIKLYHSTWSEIPAYFRWVKGHKDPYSVKIVVDTETGAERETCRYNIVQPWSGRLRAGASYCEACNSPFQGLGSDVAKLALWLVWKATMGLSELGEADPLFGCRMVNFVHDSIMTEVLEERAHAAAVRQKELMELAGRMVLPDVPVRADMIVTRQWSKKSGQWREACTACGSNSKCKCEGVKPWAERRLVPWDLRIAVRRALSGWAKETPAADREGALTYLLKKEWPRDVSREAVAEMFGDVVAGKEEA